MKFDNLDDMQVLLATADTGSFTAAGKRLGLSTAAVSAAAKRVERALGARLFDRTTRAVRPTAEGEVLVDYARRALALLSEGQAQVRKGSNGLSGSIRITVAAALAHQRLAHWLAEFVDVNPALKVDLVVSDAVVDLVRDGVDIALRHGPLADSSHTARLLAPALRVACASPAYFLRRGVPTDPSELDQHECLVYQVRGRRCDQWLFERRDGQGAPVLAKVSGRLSCNDESIAHQWALQGRGVLYQSEMALADALASGSLVRLFPDHAGEPAPLFAVLPGGRFVPRRISAVIEYLMTRFDQSPATLVVRERVAVTPPAL